jgi:hypothetical protein
MQRSDCKIHANILQDLGITNFRIVRKNIWYYIVY